MEMLEAVNIVLEATGESQIDALDDTHPQQAQIVAVVNKVSKRAQRRGWWFNHIRVTLEPDPGEGDKVIVPAELERVIAVTRGINVVKRRIVGDDLFMLVDADTQEPILDRAVEVMAVEIRDFNMLPDSFADWVAAKAAVSFVSSFEPDAPKLANLRNDVSDTQIVMNAEHIRMSRVNLFQSGSVGSVLARNYGQRYVAGVR